MDRFKALISKELEDEESLLQDNGDSAATVAKHRADARYRTLIIQRRCSLVANVFLSFVAIVLWAQVSKQDAQISSRHMHEIFTPAQSAVEYEQVVFIAGTSSERSKYQGSSNETSLLWEELYNEFGVSQISADAAARLPNATMPYHKDPSKYLVQLDVFHQLHCLNLLRKLVYPDVFAQDLTSGSAEALDTVDHLEHCYDQLRQSLQCHSDLATIYWEWTPEMGRAYGNLRTTHTCKNFEKVREWALDHRLEGDVDFHAEVEGAPIAHLSKGGAHGQSHDHSHEHEHETIPAS